MSVLCPKCKGRGTVPDWLLRIASLGMLLLGGEDDRDRNTCPTCRGKGWLTPPTRRRP